MAKIVPNLFTSYELTEEEQRTGSILNSGQVCVIQNLLSDIVQEKLLLTVDPTLPQAYLLREAELQGQIGILRYMLDNSTAALSAYESALKAVE